MNPVSDRPDFVLMSEASEQEVGDRYHEQVLSSYERYDDPDLQDYVAQLGQRLARVSHRSDIDYTFTVLDSPEINAFALPGGHIYITRGIMAYFNSEAELAGVLAHEIGHVAARHSVQQYSASTATSVAGNVLLAGVGGGELAVLAFGLGQSALIRGYGRGHELEADRLGAQYLARSGYDPSAMLDVIGLLADQAAYAERESSGKERPGYHALFDTHPDNDERLQEVIAAADDHSVADSRPDGYRAYLRAIEGMTFRAPSDEGFVLNDTYVDPGADGAFRIPPGWSMTRDGDFVVLRPDGGEAIIQVTVEPRQGKDTPRERLQKHASRSALEKGRSIEHRGGAAYTAVGRIRDAQGSGILRHVVAFHAGHVWYFDATVDEPEQFERFDRQFLDVAASLAPLDAPQRRAAGPLEIAVVRADSGTTYAGLAAGIARLPDAADRLRLLNGHWPNTRVPTGRVLKTLRSAH